MEEGEEREMEKEKTKKVKSQSVDGVASFSCGVASKIGQKKK